MGLLEICNEISSVCRKNGEPSWAKKFDCFIIEIEAGRINYVRAEIKNIFGGMGSFNDLVLQKEGAIMTYENNKLSELRELLFQMIWELY